eukprot:20050-Heterococcus_DN1.PRE.2
MSDQQYEEAYAAKLPYRPTLEQMQAAPQQMAALSFMQSCSMVAAAVNSSTAATLFKAGTTTATATADHSAAASADDISITHVCAVLAALLTCTEKRCASKQARTQQRCSRV